MIRTLCVVALLVPVAAAGQSAAVRLTDTLVTEYRTDNPGVTESSYGAVINRLDLVAAADWLTASARVDGQSFPGTNALDDDARLERLTATAQLGDWRLTLGDFPRQLGRGIVLSLRSVDELGVDLVIRGGHATYDGADHLLDLFVGRVNPSNLDTVSQRFVEDTDDLVAGGAYAFRGLGAAELSVFGVYLEPRESVLREEGQDWTGSVGVSAEVPSMIDWASLYVEADYQEGMLVGEPRTGRAGYAAIDLLPGDYSVLIEGLYLAEWEQLGSQHSVLGNRFVYNQPPTLERIDQEVFNNRDVFGGRVRVERPLLDGALVPHVNGMYRVTDRGTSAQVDQVHGFGGVELYYQEGLSRFSLSGGQRDERQRSQQIRALTHAEGDWVQAVGGGYSVHASTLNERRTLVGELDWRGSTILGMEKAGDGSFSLELGYDTQSAKATGRAWFLAGIISAEPTDSLEIRALVGTQRGGIKCVGGVCRDFPEFSGARVELVGRHALGGG